MQVKPFDRNHSLTVAHPEVTARLQVLASANIRDKPQLAGVPNASKIEFALLMTPRR